MRYAPFSPCPQHQLEDRGEPRDPWLRGPEANRAKGALDRGGGWDVYLVLDPLVKVSCSDTEISVSLEVLIANSLAI